MPGEKSVWTVYKSAEGAWRWMTLSNWAVIDKEREVVSEQAYLDAIAHAQKSGQWGELDEVHIDGTDVGDCDTLFILKGKDGTSTLGAAGTWRDDAAAAKAREAIQADPDFWGVSIKFRFNPEKRVKGVYTGDIQILKHSILPRTMAASYGTAIAVQGGEPMGKALDEKAAEALQKLGRSEDEIAELAEKQKALPQEENVAEKEQDAAGEEVQQAAEPRTSGIKRLVEQLAHAFGVGSKQEAPVASEPEEAGKADEVSPANAAQPAETEKAGGEPAEAEEVKQDEGADETDKIADFGATIAKSLGEMVQKELQVRDERIEALEAAVKALSDSVEERVEQRLQDIPPVVKVAASQVEATVVTDARKGLTFGQPREAQGDYAQKLMGDIQRVVEHETKGAQYQT